MEVQPKHKAGVFFSRLSWYRHFFDCLSLGELILLAVLNREAHNAINLLFRDKLKKEAIFFEQGASDYLKLYKEVHLKSVIILPLTSINPRDKLDPFSGAKISKKTLFVDKNISSFSFGIKFVGYFVYRGRVGIVYES